MNCQGCRIKVRKVLRKIEGVYEVDINAEEQIAIVTGIVNPSTLVQKLAKLGKHAEIWNEDYNQEDTDNDEVNDNNQGYIINDQSSFENKYMIPTLYGKDNNGPEWYYNQDMDTKTMENNSITQNLTVPSPIFYESFNNRANEYVTRMNEYPKWQWPARFQENSTGTSYSGFGNQEWPHSHNIPGKSYINEYGYQPPMMANINGYYHGYYHPSNY
ncbi:Heavy metal transport/detoxification superfamily protein [Trifolium repens]|nr:Heavy metal transport/detoxification superfamily protein [Trifolium repens]